MPPGSEPERPLQGARDPVVVVGRARARSAARRIRAWALATAQPTPAHSSIGRSLGMSPKAQTSRGVDAEPGGPPLQAGGLGHPGRRDLRQAVRRRRSAGAAVAERPPRPWEELLDGQVWCQREQLADTARRQTSTPDPRTAARRPGRGAAPGSRRPRRARWPARREADARHGSPQVGDDVSSRGPARSGSVSRTGACHVVVEGAVAADRPCRAARRPARAGQPARRTGRDEDASRCRRARRRTSAALVRRDSEPSVRSRVPSRSDATSRGGTMSPTATGRPSAHGTPSATTVRRGG